MSTTSIHHTCQRCDRYSRHRNISVFDFTRAVAAESIDRMMRAGAIIIIGGEYVFTEFLPRPLSRESGNSSTMSYTQHAVGKVRRATIDSYNTSPFAVLGTAMLLDQGERAPKNGRYYGIELEVEYNKGVDTRRAVGKVYDAMGPFAILTTDSSIEDGF